MALFPTTIRLTVEANDEEEARDRARKIALGLAKTHKHVTDADLADRS